jgi:hypothetical protein
MSQSTVLEGTGAELAQHLAANPRQRFRVSPLKEEMPEIPTSTPARPPNLKALAILQEIAERQKDRPFTDGSESLKYLREARDGGMYGYDAEDETH